MRSPRYFLLVPVLATGLVLAGCAVTATDSGTSTGDTSETTAELVPTASVDVTQTASEVLAANQKSHASTDGSDADWSESDATAIDLDDENGTVTIKAAGTYHLTGTLDEGQVVVDSPGDGQVKLVLDGVDITSSTGSAISIVAADEAVVILADGSTNTLTDAASYADADADTPVAALSSAADLTITGSGALNVTGSSNDGVSSKDGLVIAGGDITVTAVDDGIRGKDYLVITGGTLSVTAGGDGLTSDNDEDATRGYIAVEGGTVTIDAEGDGLAASTDVVTTGGTLDVTAGGGADQTVADDVSAKGVKAGAIIVLGGGDVTVDAADDAVHSDDAVHIADGVVRVATGDDGVHADDALLVSDGTLTISQSYEGLESSQIEVAGGTVSVTASDDGVNVSDGSSGGGEMGGGGGPMGGPDQAADAAAEEAADAAADDAAATDATDTTTGDMTLTISGGTLTVNSEGDGLDSNGSASMTGGAVVVNGPTGSGNGALDVDSAFAISGGSLLAVGSAGMVVAPDADADQASVSVTLDGSHAAGSAVEVTADDGTVVASFTATKEFASVVFSSPDIVNGQTYTVTVDGSAAGSAVAGEQTNEMGGGMGGGGTPPNGR